jgi:hypothetical protein
MEGTRRRREFEEALRNAIAKLGREGKDRIDRSYIEEIGQRYDLDPTKPASFHEIQRRDMAGRVDRERGGAELGSRHAKERPFHRYLSRRQQRLSTRPPRTVYQESMFGGATKQVVDT